MAEKEPLLKIVSKSSNDSIEDKIFDTHTEELILGLCGPIGTDIHFVAERIQYILQNSYNYECKIIRLSDLIKSQDRTQSDLDNDQLFKDKFKYYSDLIKSGNHLRENYGNSILAELAINQIAVQRQHYIDETGDYKSQRVCYIIDSLKNKEELNLFRLIYSDLFYFIGVFSPLENRVKYLENKNIKIDKVHELIDKDSGEEVAFGQKVTDTFQEADFFLRIDKSSSNNIEPKIKRYLELIFSCDVVTPSVHETAMYLASAAAGNSACLSRQVGAALTDENGEVISVGWNDVPKAGGSVYQFDDKDPAVTKDFRCMNLESGICFNDKEKREITDFLLKEFIEKKIIDEKNIDKAISIIKSSKIKELIEFSRSVHAEMLALIVGSQKAGRKIKNGRLYCTTYPCHNCARHIIASGIKEVYYIEPYRKSLAVKLHSDSITEDESKDKLVRLLMFEGVSPRRYLELFKVQPNTRKKDGKKVTYLNKEVTPKSTLSLQAIPILEKKITENLVHKQLINISK